MYIYTQFMRHASYAHYISKIFVPAKDLQIAITPQKPSFEATPGEKFTLLGHDFFYRPDCGLEAAMYVSSFISVTDSLRYKDRLKMIKNFRIDYSSLLNH